MICSVSHSIRIPPAARTDCVQSAPTSLHRHFIQSRRVREGIRAARQIVPRVSAGVLINTGTHMVGTDKSNGREPKRPPAPATLTAILPLLFGRESQAAAYLSAPANLIPRLALTVEQAAEATGLSRSFLYLEIDEGRLRAVKPRGATRILIWDLIDYLQSCPAIEPK